MTLLGIKAGPELDLGCRVNIPRMFTLNVSTLPVAGF